MLCFFKDTLFRSGSTDRLVRDRAVLDGRDVPCVLQEKSNINLMPGAPGRNLTPLGSPSAASFFS